MLPILLFAIGHAHLWELPAICHDVQSTSPLDARETVKIDTDVDLHVFGVVGPRRPAHGTCNNSCFGPILLCFVVILGLFPHA